MRILSEADVESLIEVPRAIELAAQAYRLQAGGTMPAPLRGDLRREDPRAGCLLLVGARDADRLAVKSNVHAYPDGPDAPRLWGSLLTLWDWRRASPRALISARAFNEHRTAAGFAAAARILAPKQPRTLAIFGAGKSAPMALRHLKAACPTLDTIILAGRSPGRVAALKQTLESFPDLAGVTILTATSPADAAARAEIIVTVTTSDTPVFPGEAARAGACVILGGANRPQAREGDDALMRRADVYLDARQGMADKAGDIALALASGALTPERMVAEIGACEAPLQLSPGSDLRVFKSMGLSIQDLLLAEDLTLRAEALDIGQVVDLDGRQARP